VEPVEIEVKLAVLRSAAGRALIEGPPLTLAGFTPDGPARVETVTDRYLDTALETGALRAAGLRARLRQDAVGGVVLTVKGRGIVDANGVTSRMELEGPATADLDPATWPRSAARTRVVETAGDASFVEIAAVRQRRHVRRFRRGEAVVELSLDELDALDGEAVLDSRLELEAELKAGPAAALADLAAALARVDGLGPAAGSKLEFALLARRRDRGDR